LQNVGLALIALALTGFIAEQLFFYGWLGPVATPAVLAMATVGAILLAVGPEIWLGRRREDDVWVPNFALIGLVTFAIASLIFAALNWLL